MTAAPDPQAGLSGLRPASAVGALALLGAVATVAFQVPYPLASDDMQRVLTILSVVTFFTASLLHAVDTRGPRAALGLAVVCVGGGLSAEAIGWRTGVPFGAYRYNDSLGVNIAGVPLIVALAWAMMAWPALLGGRRVADRLVPGRHAAGAALVAMTGSLVLVSWDLFLDPQMVDAGHWTWLPTPGPWLHGIPVVNSVGWLGVGALMVLLLHLIVPVPVREGRSDVIAWLLLGWTWFSEVVGHTLFFGRPSVGLVGGCSMAVVLAVVVRPQLLGHPS